MLYFVLKCNLKNKIVRKIERIGDIIQNNSKTLEKSYYINMLKKDYKCYYYAKRKSQYTIIKF